MQLTLIKLALGFVAGAIVSGFWMYLKYAPIPGDVIYIPNGGFL